MTPWLSPGRRLRRIVLRHARKIDPEHEARCVPTELEILKRHEIYGRAGKVIYDTERAARACAQALQAAGFDRQEVYECPRRERHWHLRKARHR